LLRLGTLAGEMQSLLAPLADGLLDRAVHRATGSHPATGAGFVCRCDDLAGQPRYLVRETLKLAWRREGWPEQAMGLAEWEALAELAQAAASPGPAQRDFPGGIRARRQDARLFLTPAGAALG
jgi:hypothetical protein